jgi:hypothetical protein
MPASFGLGREPASSVAVPLCCTYEQLASILSQSHPVDEIVVSDDASSDESLYIVADIRCHAGAVRITFLRYDT